LHKRERLYGGIELRRVKEKDWIEMKTLYDRGLNFTDISKELGWSDKTVSYYLEKHYEIKLNCHKRLKNGGKTKNKFGYVLVLAPDHPNCGPSRYVKEHRLVMEKHLGRLLSSDEHIHHINGIKDDNRIENLMIMTNSEHLKLESSMRVFKNFHNNYKHITKEQLLTEIDKGLSFMEISKNLDISRTTFYTKLEKYKIRDYYDNNKPKRDV
jgi:hypothetical protein